MKNKRRRKEAEACGVHGLEGSWQLLTPLATPVLCSPEQNHCRLLATGPQDGSKIQVRKQRNRISKPAAKQDSEGEGSHCQISRLTVKPAAIVTACFWPEDADGDRGTGLDPHSLPSGWQRPRATHQRKDRLVSKCCGNSQTSTHRTRFSLQFAPYTKIKKAGDPNVKLKMIKALEENLTQEAL